jgi:YidC/Oxa1 family membrane protein insertase
MDRNSAIGLTLIAVLLLVYFNFFSPKPPPPPAKPANVTTTDLGKPDSATATPMRVPRDSDRVKQYGTLSSFLAGDEVLTRVETKDLIVTLSNQATLQQLELKNFKTYAQKPLLLTTANSSLFSLVAPYEGKDIDLYQLHYSVTSVKSNDTTTVTYEAKISANAYLRHVYSIPSEGFKIGYRIESAGLSNVLTGPGLTFRWTDRIPLQEKDITDSRTRTTVNYYLAKGAFDGLSESSLKPENETFKEPVKWVSIKQKFFLSAIIGEHPFAGGDIAMSTDLLDAATVKTTQVSLFIPKADLTANGARFDYFFGPNDYDLIGNVSPGFSRNLYLGWPPVIWVNKFVIIPIFNFLQKFIGNYGIIIVLLVLFIKLLLTPLSYSSYLGMAKMKLLKPELDAIKEKNGDNAAQTQQDQMKLYQQAGVNPFSGCIPLVLQMPILFAMFYFFPVSIQLRQKHFLWAEDLSTYDSVFNLPFSIPFYGDHVSLFVLLMTASTIVYQWQNNQMGTVQGPMKSMSYIMPVVFMFVLNKFSAGLSFYYFVSNLVTFAQQAVIRRFVDDSKIKLIIETNKKKAASGTGKKSSFMSRLEGAMKASEEAKRKSRG